MGDRIKRLVLKWRQLKATEAFHDVTLYLVFVVVSAFFWLILAFNESSQDGFNVKISIVNCPDSVTFISDIPQKMHVTVRDKGSRLFRTHFRHPTLNIDFKDASNDGVLRLNHAEIVTGLKSIFGTSSQIVSISLDSLHLDYTTNRGHRVPVVLVEDVTAASGNVIEGNLRAKPSSVLVYGEKDVLDTIHRVLSEPITLSDLSETTIVDVKLVKIKNARILPSTIKVTVPVEPLVKKEALVTITPVNVPPHKNMLIFPSKVPVSYYVAMSRLNDDEDDNIKLLADYYEAVTSGSEKVHVQLQSYPDRLKNLTVRTDSVEYTIVER